MAIGTLLFVALLIFTLVVMRALPSPDKLTELSPGGGVHVPKNSPRSALPAGAALLAAGVLAAGCSGSSASSGGSGSNAPVTIKAVLPPNTGPITAADNAGLQQLTQQYEAAHKNVTVQWLPNNTSSITQANARLESQASGGSAPDVVWEQYGPVTSGALPAGLLQNIKPYLEKPNPYVSGNSSWLSLFTPSTVPYMTSPNGDIDIILGSNVETGCLYSKAAFAKAGITSPPATWADLMTDLGKLKSAGITPLMFTDGEPCNPSWFERLATSSLLAESGQPVQRQPRPGDQRPGRRGRHPQGHHQHEQPALRGGLEAARPARRVLGQRAERLRRLLEPRTPPRRR